MQYKKLLKEYVMKKSQFLDLPDGETVKTKYLGVEEIPNKFDGGETTVIRYHLEVNGKEFLWDRANRDLAKQMINLDIGQEIFISRKGKKNKTKYLVEKA